MTDLERILILKKRLKTSIYRKWDRCFPPLVVSTTVLSTTVFSTTVLSTTSSFHHWFFPPLPNYPNQRSHTVISCIMNLACQWYLLIIYYDVYVWAEKGWCTVDCRSCIMNLACQWYLVIIYYDVYVWAEKGWCTVDYLEVVLGFS